MNLIFFGPPGAGKGTQSELLVERLKMKQISTGDLFRVAIRNGSPLGREAKAYMDKGHLVPDSVTIGLVREELSSLKGQSFILDGFPRNILQAEALAGLLADLHLEINHVLFLEVEQRSLLGRLAGRRVCRQCGSVYHIDSKPPKNRGICDNCQGEVYQRPDDSENVIQNRLDAYENSTKPLKEYYKKSKTFIEVDGMGSAEQVFERIKTAIQVKV